MSLGEKYKVNLFGGRNLFYLEKTFNQMTR